ncbi:unnamed protein product [Ostreobium quekettii]|uniref:Sialate O-acetylesterase domain-containing protein n=1 Tax=Ostreobium quekettii TaxID=121088 RepID=A0A8S1IJW4_9CHLO|nr:unnamed protein product [Ostreobium quekettii]
MWLNPRDAPSGVGVACLQGSLLVALSATASGVEFDVFLIGGQSNASGRGNTADIPVGSPLAIPQTDVQFYWHKTLGNVSNGNLAQDQIIDLQPGSGHGRNSPAGHPSEFGSELSFGRTLAEAFPQRNIMLVKYGHGGSNLHTQWASGGDMYNTFVDTVEAALAVLDLRGDTYNLRGMTWLQGEADTSAANAAAYQNNLVNLIDRVRTDVFNGEDAPFVLTRLSDNQYASLGSGQITVRAAQSNAPNLRPNVATIDTDNDTLYTTYSNGLIHFDANGQIGLGNALGQQMVSMLTSPPEPMTSVAIFNASPENSTGINNGAGSAGVDTLAGATGTLTLESTWGTNHAFGLASTDTIDSLAAESPLGRALRDTDTVRVTAVVTGITGDLNSNGVEFGLAPTVGFRPSPHLIFQVDADGAASGLAHFPGSGSPATSFWVGVTGSDDAVWGVDEASLLDGFTISIEANKDGFTVTISDAEFVDNGSATPGVFHGAFTGTEFIDNFGGGHLYFTAQKSGAAMIVNLGELSIEVAEPLLLTADFNRDGVVDAADYTVWRDHSGEQVTPCTEGDANGDGAVTTDDYAEWKASYGAQSSALRDRAPGLQAPGPASMALLWGAALIMLFERP